jgi:hypothetical protein
MKEIFSTRLPMALPIKFGGEKGKKYKTKKMKEFFRSIYDQPIAEQGNMIKKEFNDWRGRLEQIDDVCVIGVRV